MIISCVLITVGLFLILIGCFIEIIGMFSIKDKKLYSLSLLPGFFEGNIIDAFKFKYRQIEGFMFIFVGTIFQIIPNIWLINIKIRFSIVIIIICLLIIASFFIDNYVVFFSKSRYDKELAIRTHK